MIAVFVFGTLKQGFPNHSINHGQLIDAACSTTQAYPLYLVGERYSPWLINDPGNGVKVQGELYAVNRNELAMMDELERTAFADGYRRIPLEVTLSTGATRQAYCYVKSPRQLASADIRLGPLDVYRLQHAQLYRSRAC